MKTVALEGLEEITGGGNYCNNVVTDTTGVCPDPCLIPNLVFTTIQSVGSVTIAATINGQEYFFSTDSLNCRLA